MSISTNKINFFERIIADFFKKVGRDHLPWRTPRKTASRGKGKITAYEVWVSEIMLQQTQVSRVIGYYERFLLRYPTVESLAESDWEEFLPYYKGLGYYARGRNMLLAAKEVVSKHEGKFPRDAEALRGLPGIGSYTASAILSFAYGDSHLAWDTNLKRVIGRFFFGSRRAEFDMEDMASRFSLQAKTLNAALMDFGSAICLARPKCDACPLRTRCVYFSEDGKNESRIRNPRLPARQEESRKKRKEVKIDWKEARAIVFLHENHRKYFSAKKERYEPFILAKGYNSRAGVKDWFEKNHGLTVSVRPPHKKLITERGPILLVNVQILSGNQNFTIFSKKEYQVYVGRF